MYALTLFLSAFLLFQMQPIIAKIILPWFGGSAAVWTTCMMFFQGALCLGYLYSLALVRCMSPRAQAILHSGLLGISLLVLPIFPAAHWKPSGGEDPALRIVALLAAAVGLPYFLLATTSPLLQAWRAEAPKSGAPYRLYALSNAGSMLALITYPMGVERLWTTHQQSRYWSISYGAFVLLCAYLALRRWRIPSAHLEVSSQPPTKQPDENGAEPETKALPGAGRHLLWLTLSACATALLLAVTDHLTQDIASVPFLWVIPLALYLLSYIVCFGVRQWEWKPLYVAVPVVTLAALTYSLDDHTLPPIVLIVQFTLGLFVLCVFCHGELARTRPHPRHLTSFYLMIALGGAVGGLFVGFLAPRLFNDNYELPICLGVGGVLALFRLYRYPALSHPNRSRPAASPDASNHQTTFWNRQTPAWSGRDPRWTAALALTVVFIWALIFQAGRASAGYRRVTRSFYGVLRVRDRRVREAGAPGRDRIRELFNGGIEHGAQFLNPAHRMEPITYYGPDSGVGLALRGSAAQPRRRVGVIGLGVGTLAAYAHPGDRFRFYEINPLVIHLAQTEFTYLSGCRGTAEIVPGDARLSLDREPDQRFDLLVLDAFSGDSIPVHLLTREALALYFRHLRPGGVLALHASNRYLDLRPIMEREAEALHKQARAVRSTGRPAHQTRDALWVLMADRADYFSTPLLKAACEPLEARPGLRAWTDDYSNLFQVLKAGADE